MVSAPAPWQLTLARIEGALPFISPELSQCLALASLRRLWRVHVRDYPFDNLGIEHNPGLEADELMRSWYSEERLLSSARLACIRLHRMSPRATIDCRERD